MDVETLSPCPSCGGTLAIDPGHDTIRCTHCATRHLPEGMEVTTARGCAACGARIAVNPQIMAAACPFCASPFTVLATQDRHPEPDFVVPFAVTETQARAQIRHWLSKQWLAPAGLRRSALSGDALHGMYLPY
ncbi:hypothetical protein PARPLA_02279 [Rhodobacteraceae bacterium THAF1]|uniref:hypothetical protein n=1 Tax=Palleronia sp. THAF1 TaxID=2587842 RepID=UPI000F3E4CB2|nr:hypothetical protein [Palleronia sp. THAF1]QFU09313.1 hypothetical protein FIU81_11575 [Palleronia sp. THAF1]VDC26722.1 hypothetical protein PARPLA_02279 [Rhodobacteraceae bacterium THAF1]